MSVVARATISAARVKDELRDDAATLRRMIDDSIVLIRTTRARARAAESLKYARMHASAALAAIGMALVDMEDEDGERLLAGRWSETDL
jgi:hypothetical protein